MNKDVNGVRVRFCVCERTYKVAAMVCFGNGRVMKLFTGLVIVESLVWFGVQICGIAVEVSSNSH